MSKLESNYYLTKCEVSVILGISDRTLENWYMWKRQNPDNELSKLLPEPIQQGGRQTRYWKKCDIAKIFEFKKNVKKGRNGIMGKITNRKGKNHNDK